jgi:Protein of unknown function (DUF1648)
MNAQYRHSQPGYLSIVIISILIAVGAVMYICGLRPPGMLLCVICFVCLVFSYKLTVEIKDGFLKFWFGPGLFWKKIPLEQIAYCEPFKGVFGGWGIRYICNGWLYNVSGMKAVTIVLKSGKRMHIGTDDLLQLVAAVNSAIRGLGADETLPMWAEVKTDYLKRVEQALSAKRHPRSFEILADVSNHLDSRFAELEPENRNWENFQKIATEMGPPSDYADLVGGKKTKWYLPSAAELISICLIFVMCAVSVYFYPRMPEQMATHWDMYGQVNGYMPKLAALVLFPVILAVIAVSFVVVPRVASLWANIEGFRKFFGGLAVLLSVFLSLVQYLTIMWNLGIKINPVIVILPMTAALIGWIMFMLYRANRRS